MPLEKSNLSTIDDIFALPNGVRAELIDGVLYNMTPPSRMHQKIVRYLTRKIDNHILAHGGTCEVYPAPFAVRLFKDDLTYVEPDISVICDPAKLKDWGCDGAPDWVVEVLSPSSVAMDNFLKLNAYRDAGVREYTIVDPLRRIVRVYGFESGNYQEVDFDEPVRTDILEGLLLDFDGLS